MPHPREGLTGGSARSVGRNLVLDLTLILVLAAVSVSTGLVVHTAWNHDLNNGPFALAFAVLSARTALSPFQRTPTTYRASPFSHPKISCWLIPDH